MKLVKINVDGLGGCPLADGNLRNERHKQCTNMYSPSIIPSGNETTILRSLGIKAVIR